MAENNIKISGIGDVSRSDFLRAITDTDKFREFADQQGWGNKRRQMAWDSLNNYAQGVKNGEINEINDMHQIVDDTGVRTNKKERYNWIGSKFDANGATAAFMNSVAKGMATKKDDKTLKAVPTVSSYLNNLWFGSDTPDWALFQKNDVLTKDKYGITNRMAKLKAGLQSLKNTLTTKGAEYNWDGVDKDKLFSNLDNAINSSNVAAYAPLGLTSDYLNSALATKDLSLQTVDTDYTPSTQTTTQTAQQDPINGLTQEQLQIYNTMTPEQQKEYLANLKAAQNLTNEEVLYQQKSKLNAAQQQIDDRNFTNWLKANGYYSPKAQFTSSVSARVLPSSSPSIKGPAVKNMNEYASAEEKYAFTPQEWSNFIVQDLSKDIGNSYALKNINRKSTTGTVAIKSKLDWLNYNFNQLATNGDLNKIGDDVSSYVGAAKGTVWRLKNSKRSSDGTYMYMRKKGNNLEFYRSKSWGDLKNNEYKQTINKHQFGGELSNRYRSYAKDLKTRQEALEKKENQTPTTKTPLRSPRTKQQLAAGQRELGNLGELTAADKAQLAGMALDISATAASFLPGAGNIAGAGLGLAGTFAHAYADAKDDAVSRGEFWTNLGTSLAFDTVGAIPVIGSYGKLAKLGRVGKALANNHRLIGFLTTAFAAPNIISAAPGAGRALSKISNGDFSKLTADELRDLATATSMTASGTRMVRTTTKYAQKNPKRGDTVSVHTTDGKKTIKASEYEEIMQKPTLTARNDLLRTATGDDNIKFDNGLLHNYAPESFWHPFKNPVGFFGKLNPLSQVRNTSDPELKYIFKSNEQIRQKKTANNPSKEPSQEIPNTEQSNPQSSNTVIRTDVEVPKPTPTLTKEQLAQQRKSDIDLLTKRFTSDKPLPIDNKTRAAYERFRKRPMTDSEIKKLEIEQRIKRLSRIDNKTYITRDQIYADALNSRKQEIIKQQKIAEEAAQLKADIERAQAELRDARYSRLGILGIHPILGTNGTIPKSPATHSSAWEISRELGERAKAAEIHNERAAFYEKKFGDLRNLSDEEKAIYAEGVRRDNSFRQQKAQEYESQRKAARAQRSQELMEVFGNLPSNNTKNHVKNTNLPHKQPKKKPKPKYTSVQRKDYHGKRKHLEGGILYDYDFLNSVHAFKKGGIIKANHGVKTNSNIYAGEGEDYSYDNYLNKYFQNAQMLAYMRNHYNTIDDYAKDVINNVNSRYTNGINNYDNSTTYTANEGVRDFNRSYQGEDGSRTFNYTMFGGNTDDYNNMTNGVAYTLIKGWNRPAKNIKTGDSYNIDPKQAYVDNAHGLQTYSRVMSLTNKDIKSGGFGEWGDSWKARGATGAYYYIADGDTSGKGQWVPTADTTKKGYIAFDTEEKEDDGSKTNPNENIGKKSIFQKGKEYLSKLTSDPGNLYNAIETGKYLLANKTTNDLAKIKMPGYTLSKKRTSYKTQDDMSRWNEYTSASAASLNWAAKHPATSSGQLQAAQMHDAMNWVNQNNIKGGVARNTHLDSEADKTYKAGVYNMENSVDTTNANAQLAWKVRVQNEYEDPRARLIGLATNRQNWINALEKFNVIDPYTERKNAMQQYGLAKAQWDYSNDAAVNQAYENYKKEIKANENNSSYDASTSDAAKKYREAQKEATARYYNNMYSIYGIKNPNFQTVTFSKKGGKFEDISKFNTKEFYNTVRHSINTALKQGTNLSKLLISKSTRK